MINEHVFPYHCTFRPSPGRTSQLEIFSILFGETDLFISHSMGGGIIWQEM